MLNNKRENHVAIMTYHYANNYGAVLQAYALQYFILNSGVKQKVEFINFIPHSSDAVKKNEPFYIHLKRNIGAIFNKYKKLLMPRILLMSRMRAGKFTNFRQQYFNVSKECNSIDDLTKVSSDYNIFIVGSDQVWNAKIAQIPEAYYFSFVANRSLNSYAASFGKDKLSDIEIELCKKYLPRFNHIYVREQSAKKLLTNIGINSKVVLDPAFLLNAEQWEKIETPIKLKNKYVFFYLMETVKHIDKIVTFFKREGYSICYCDANGQTGIINGKCLNYLSPGEFVYTIKNAEYVVTNSFHGTAFSIIFGKQILSIKHTSRNARLQDLLSEIEMSDKQINLDEIENVNIREKIISTKNCNIDNQINFAKKAVIKIIVGD